MKTVPGLPVFLFDGDCAFCSSCARFIDRRIPTDATVVPWQWTELEGLGVGVDEVDVAVIWVTSSTSHTAGPAAIADLLRSSTGRPWQVMGRLLAPAPVLWATGFAYRWVARNRDKMPGGTAQCALPQAHRGPNGPSAPTTDP